MPPANGNKWTDSAVKDLTFAILMSNGDGNFNVNANWDNVLATMNGWGYDFTKSAMSQHWTKRIIKDFKERHAEAGAAGPSGGSTTSTPRGKRGRTSAAGTPKTPGSSKATAKGKGGKGKGKRAHEDDGDDDNEENDTPPERTNSTVDPIARNKIPRASTSAKKVKYEEQADDDEDVDEKGEFAGYALDTPVFRGPIQEDEAFEGI